MSVFSWWVKHVHSGQPSLRSCAWVCFPDGLNMYIVGSLAWGVVHEFPHYTVDGLLSPLDLMLVMGVYCSPVTRHLHFWQNSWVPGVSTSYPNNMVLEWTPKIRLRGAGIQLSCRAPDLYLEPHRFNPWQDPWENVLLQSTFCAVSYSLSLTALSSK